MDPLLPEGWDDVTAAVAAARSGRPTVVVFEGGPGTGKSTLLAEVSRRADGFDVLAADAEAGEPQPFGVLARWGVDVADEQHRKLPSMLVAQRLRERVDALSNGPLVLQLDDVQWADPESLEALAALLRRAAGDRLLVTVAGRPATAGVRASGRWLPPDATVKVRLTGLSRSAAAALVRRRAPGLNQRSTDALWRHTDGNPLYLTALLEQFGEAELGRMRVLPAPAEYRQLVEVRLGRLPEPAVRLVQAAAVLGTGWTPLPLLAAVAGVPTAAQAVEVAAEHGLLEIRGLEGGISVRCVHALTRAAVYQSTSLTQRQQQHLRAADLVEDRPAALGHRVAAADQWDDDLAAELEVQADLLHAGFSHRLAAQYREWAANLWSDGRRRNEARWESRFDAVQAGEIVELDPDQKATADVGSQARAAVVAGARAVLTGRWREGARQLLPVVRDTTAADDPLTRYRAECLLAWTRMGTGEPTSLILDGLARAESLGVHDPTVAPYALFAGGQAAARVQGAEAMLAQLAGLPDDSRDLPGDQTYLLAWRGALRTHLGLLAGAVADLTEAEQRIQSGLTDIAHGGFHGILGVAQWLHGNWDLAQVSFGLARQLSEDFVLPLVLTYTPLHLAGVGRFADADRELAEAVRVVQDMPWPEAVQALLIARVVRAHAAGDQELQRTVWADTRQRWPDTDHSHGLIGATWLMHATLAAIWSHDRVTAQQFLTRMRHLSVRPDWLAGALRWLAGLLAEEGGDPAGALRQFRAAAAADTAAVPLYRAHLLADLARVARAQSRTDEADQAQQQALDLYSALGAAPYVDRLTPTAPPPDRTDAEPAPLTGIATSHRLTEREHDVATLLVRGLSYAQIARHLFITQSTVAYHLTNVYAKAGVRSRHQFVELITT